MLKSGVTVTSLKNGNYKVIVEIDKIRDGLFPDCIGSAIIELPNEYNGLVKTIESCIKREINKLNKNNL